MSEQFWSLTELGKLYGVSSHKIGNWLVNVGLRTPQKKPSTKAFQDGFVRDAPSTQPGTYYWIWNVEKTIQLLDDNGFGKPVITQATTAANG